LEGISNEKKIIMFGSMASMPKNLFMVKNDPVENSIAIAVFMGTLTGYSSYY
jgi:hypothetical protein